jgi:hypothetical protein
MIVGYARVSTQEQDLSAQLEGLKKAGAQKVFREKVSGAKTDRPELAKLMRSITKGDTLIITKSCVRGMSCQLRNQAVDPRSLGSLAAFTFVVIPPIERFADVNGPELLPCLLVRTSPFINLLGVGREILHQEGRFEHVTLRLT